MTYVWSEEMGEISGFGGDYEKSCRAMFIAGLDWFDLHPTANPVFTGISGVYGLLTPKNDEAKQLEDAIMSATFIDVLGGTVRAGDEATGAMHHAVIQHVMTCRKLGWEKYQEEVKTRE